MEKRKGSITSLNSSKTNLEVNILLSGNKTRGLSILDNNSSLLSSNQLICIDRNLQTKIFVKKVNSIIINK